MYVDQAAAGEYLFKLVGLQLVHAGAAGDDNGLYVHVVEGVCHAVKQYPVIRGYAVSLPEAARRYLGVSAAEISRRQHHLGTGFQQHSCRCHGYVAV